MTEISDATFRNAMNLIADIAPYKHVKDAIRDANNLAPYLKDEPGIFKDEDDTPSDKALSELRDKLTGDDEDRPRYLSASFDRSKLNDDMKTKSVLPEESFPTEGDSNGGFLP